MRYAIASIAALALVGCATVVPPATVIVAGETWDGALVAMDTAALAANVVVTTRTPQLTSAQYAQIASIATQARTVEAAGNAAYAAGKTGTVAAEIAALQALTTQLNSAH